MTSTTQFGVRLANSGPLASAENIFELAEHSQGLGYERVWVHDHVSWPPEMLKHFSIGSVEACDGQDPNVFDSITTLAMLGARLPRIGLGVAGLVLPLRDPRILAKQLATIDRSIGAGRLVVGVGLGAIQHDFETMGVPFNRRGRIGDDYLVALDAILRGSQPVDVDTEHVRFSGGYFHPRPDGEIPLWLAAGAGDRSLRRVVEHCDGWLPGLLTVEEYQAGVSRLRQLAASGGRDPDKIALGFDVFACVGRTREEALAISAASLQDRVGDAALGVEKNLIGTPTEITERVLRFRDAGVQHFELRFIANGMDSVRWMSEQVAEHVIPAVQ